MSWKDLLQKPGETIVLPWIGGRSLRLKERLWTIKGPLPSQNGWFEFDINGKIASLVKPAELNESVFQTISCGYVIGDRLIVDGSNVDPSPAKIASRSESVFLLEPGLDRFARVVAGRVYEGGELIFIRQDFPLGPEEHVLIAFHNRKDSVSHIKNVIPALDAAFLMESWQRSEIERRRAELERFRLEEEAKRALEERRIVLASQLGTGSGRRAMASVDFAEAARSALAAGGAIYVDHRKSHAHNEMIVNFQIERRHFECVCNIQDLCIIDAGICLTSHDTGTKYDDRLTLESLPGVIRQAIREGKLVVFRHVGNEDHDGYD